jgi:site-specific DNA-cytosine methylase
VAGDAFNVLSLCAGVAGIDLGIKLAVPGSRAVCFVEREAYCAEVLARRMEEGALAPAPVWSDLRTFDGRPWRGVVDCVAAGFPCQPVSRAGRRQREAHASWLWDDVVRVVRECAPGFVFIENVDALRANGGVRVARDLVACGYELGWVLDYYMVESAWTTFCKPHLDHRYLNEVQGLANPTTEVIAVWIWDRLKPLLETLTEVVVRETPNFGVRYAGEKR